MCCDLDAVHTPWPNHSVACLGLSVECEQTVLTQVDSAGPHGLLTSQQVDKWPGFGVSTWPGQKLLRHHHRVRTRNRFMPVA